MESAVSRRQLLWSLVALLAMLAPAVDRVRAWILILVGALIVWRLGRALLGWPLPGRLLRGALTLGVLLAVYLSYRTLNGVVAGSALLAAMAGLKLVESRGRRDYFLLLIIALFIGLANFLYAPRMGLAIYMLPALWLTITALIVVGYGRGMPPRQAGGIALGLMLPAALVAAILFVIFPRVPGPLWGQPAPGTATAGVSDSMAPGSISQLVSSDRVAFRVKFDGTPPASLYWRGPVLHRYAHGVWSRGPAPRIAAKHIQLHGAPLRYTVTLEPDSHRWLYALAVAASWPDDAALAGDYTLYTEQPVRERRRYSVVSYPQAGTGAGAPAAAWRRDLQLPPGGNPQARALAARWRNESPSARTIVKHALALFHDGNFYYTLNPPPLGRRNPIDRFLFTTRQGFCEHYASAFTFLMRAAGVPARVVTGYVGGERNPIDGYWIVRDAQAHAWAEVWIAPDGWVRVDPTSALPPNRVDVHTAATLAAANPGRIGGGDWLRHLGYAWDAANTLWNQWVLGYGPLLQKTAFAHFGIDYSRGAMIAVVMLIALAAIFAITGGWFVWRSWPARAEPAIRLYASFCRKLGQVGIRRRSTEGPLDFAARAARQRPDCAHTIHFVTQLYIRLRYHPEPPARSLRRLAAAVAGFQPERRV